MAANLAAIAAWLSVFICLLVNPISAQTKTKRQIYREQVLPLSGGKIPEDAFRADRLALNRLNKEGIAIPDGVLLEHRNAHSHPHTVKHDPEDEDSVLKIIQQPEHRYTPEEGRYHDETPLTVSSTYLIRKPIGRDEIINIRAPQQQMPHYQAVLNRENKGYPSYQNSNGYQTIQSQTPPQPAPSRYPINYHQPQPTPLAYYSIPVPLELPNKEIQQEQYYLKQYENSYPSAEDVSGRIDWSLLQDNFERLPYDLNNLLPSSGYNYDPPSYHYYSSPESLSNFDEFSSFFGDRYVRKSPEGHVKGGDVKKRRKELDKSSSRAASRTFYKRIAQVRCIDQESSKCQ